MKRIVICFDGTWNKLDAKHPTNVVLTAQSIAPTDSNGIAQTIFYDEGVGTEKTERLRGGAFGRGLVKNLADGYRFLIFNYEPGDELYVFGFSRGAYTARSFVGLLGAAGVLARHEASRIWKAIELYKTPNREVLYPGYAQEFRAEYAPAVAVSEDDRKWRAINGFSDVADVPLLSVRYLGVWDTVGALGIPNHLKLSPLFNRRHEFHDTSLSALVQSARHAVAIDERRKTFEPTLWQNLELLNHNKAAEYDGEPKSAPFQQVWFPGVHGAVGGGGDRRGLSDNALEWIWDGARHAGLKFDSDPRSAIYSVKPDHADPLNNSSDKPSLLWRLIGAVAAERKPGPDALTDVSVSAKRRWHTSADRLPERVEYRPGSLSELQAELDDDVPEGAGVHFEALAESETLAHHIVQKGETLSDLALSYYGSAGQDHWRLIFEANTDKLDNPDRIYVGQVLRVPLKQLPARQ